MNKKIPFSSLFLFAAFTVQAEAIFPLPDGVCVETSAQTWKGSSEQEVKLDKSYAIVNGPSDRIIGYTKIEKNSEYSCGQEGECQKSNSEEIDRRLPSRPDFSINGIQFDSVYEKQQLTGSQTLKLSNGIYRVKEILKLDGDSKLIIDGSVTLYVEKMEVLANAKIEVTSGNPDDFIVISRNGNGNESEVILKGNNTFSAHIFAQEEVELSEFVKLKGTITAPELEIKDNAQLMASLPRSCNSTNRSIKFEFGTVEQKDCTMSEGRYTCTINFDKTYTRQKPLVFVMPTIDKTLSGKPPYKESRETEYPSSVSVINTSYSSATIIQEFPPHTKADQKVTFLDKSSDKVQKEMAKVDYFVIEPGVLELNNGAKVVAGTINTNVAASQYNSKGVNEQKNGVTINFNDYGLSSFGRKPGILVQPQTKNNTSIGNWFTGMARDASTTSFKLALEKSEVYQKNKSGNETFNKLTEKETVAFVAGEGSGYINGQRFWLGDGQTLYTLNQKDPVIDPVVEGCNVYTPFPASAGFEAPPVLVANKNSRNGNNGGWLRRCDVTSNSVAFIVEEDMHKDKERGHLSEDVGWFMFEKPAALDVCEPFRSPVQTWYDADNPNSGLGEGRLYISGSAQIKGARTMDENGDIIRIVGFDDSKVSGDLTGPAPDYEQRINAGCDGTRCWGNSDLKVPRDTLESFPSSNSSGSTWIGTPQTWRKGRQVEGILSIGSELTLMSGTYWIDRLEINNSGKLLVPEGQEVVLNVKEMNVGGFLGMDIKNIENNSQYEGYLRVNVYDIPFSNPNARVDFNGSSKFIGLLYSEAQDINGNESVQLSGTEFYGALTAVSVELNSSAQIIRSSSCLAPTNQYEFDLSPTSQLALMCGDDAPVFDIITRNSSVPVSTSIDISIPNSDGVAFKVQVLKGSGSLCSIASNNDTCRFFSNNEGELKLTVLADETDALLAKQRYKLNATLVQDMNKSKEVSFSFVPYKFDIKSSNQDEWDNSAIPMIANKPVDIDVRVLACPLSSDSSSPVVLKYNHSLKDDDVSSLITMPSANQSGAISLSSLDFKDGLAKSSVTFTDSGEATITLKDSEFDCDSFDELKDPDTKKCQIDGGILSGEFSVKSRPWKFSVCPQSAEGEYVSANGNSNSGNAFVAAGQLFSVRVAPLKYNSPECSEQEQLTHNYFLSEASAELSYTLDSPVGGILGNLSGTLVRNVSDDKKIAYSYVFSDLAYSEVGSINLSALETGVFYSSIEVDGDKGVKGSRKIGRFYPDSFVINSTKWDAPKNQGNISYMGQNFDLAEVSILPYGMGSSAPLKNYHLIDDGYQAKLTVLGDGKVSNSLILDTSLGDWRENPDVSETSQWYLQDAFAYVTKPLDENGPFNTNDRLSKATEFSLEISGKDPVRFKNSSSESYSISAVLPSQPPVRFGRMLLSDVGGYQGQKLTVPLSVEFWNGERFVINVEDNNTSVINFIQKQTPIWPDDGTDCSVLLEGNATVSGGKTRKIKAQQDLATCQSSVRQQTEVWLGLDSDGSNVPWLKYDWDNDNAEENPSSVVTFGIHRGNDRVIYRGEPGLTGQ
ncbi:MSHA biogenesis protein MshQ [Vibrio parahaemolyticus]|nr:MSHA biogenesis protein MshQ [Vibrio parahaemolyticus]